MRIHLPAETWVEIFAWLNRREFAQKMELLWDREFSPIAEKWLHEWSKNVKIGSLEFVENRHINQAELWRYQREGNSNNGFGGRRNVLITRNVQNVPIAEMDMPANICSFGEIRILYMDNTVQAFLRKIQPLFRNKVHFSIKSHCDRNHELKAALDHLLPMFNGGGGGEFDSVRLVNDDDVLLLNENRYASALLNTKLLSIENDSFSMGGSNFYWLHPALAKWLFTKRQADCQPRMLALPYRCYQQIRDLIAIIQQRFLAATTEAETFPFIVRFGQFFYLDQFNETERTIATNDKNGQQLIILVGQRASCRYILLVSCPLDVNPEHLAKWKRDMMLADSSLGESDERTFRLIFPKFGYYFGPIDPNDRIGQQKGAPAPVNPPKIRNKPPAFQSAQFLAAKARQTRRKRKSPLEEHHSSVPGPSTRNQLGGASGQHNREEEEASAPGCSHWTSSASNGIP